jgi:hypothetical protein
MPAVKHIEATGNEDLLAHGGTRVGKRG